MKKETREIVYFLGLSLAVGFILGFLFGLGWCKIYGI